MTAITTRPVDQSTDSLLRFALRADATLCAGIGLFVAALVAYGALLFVLAGLRDVRRVGIGVLAGNIAFAVAVGVVLAAGWLPLTALGVVMTIAFTVVTLAFAYVQYLGVRRLA
jgi:hypothetical protein